MTEQHAHYDNANATGKTIERLRLERIFERRKSPYNCYGDYQRTHDAEGHLMPAGWDYEAYWTKWFNTHYEPVPSSRSFPSEADKVWEECTAGVPRNQAAYDYWKSVPPQEEVDENINRILSKVKHMFNA